MQAASTSRSTLPASARQALQRLPGLALHAEDRGLAQQRLRVPGRARQRVLQIGERGGRSRGDAGAASRAGSAPAPAAARAPTMAPAPPEHSRRSAGRLRSGRARRRPRRAAARGAGPAGLGKRRAPAASSRRRGRRAAGRRSSTSSSSAGTNGSARAATAPAAAAQVERSSATRDHRVSLVGRGQPRRGARRGWPGLDPGSVDRAVAAVAAGLARIDVAAVAAVLGRRDVGERAPRRGVSSMLTPSPSRLFGKTLKPSTSTPPTTTRSTMSVTSSSGRRPLGKPAGSPPSRPRRLALGERRRRHADVEPQQIGDRAGLGARGRDRRRVGDERQEIGARRRRDVERRRPPAPRARSTDRARSRRTGHRPPARARLHASLKPVPMISSLNSGLPMRWTWTNALALRSGGPGAALLDRLREVEP